MKTDCRYFEVIIEDRELEGPNSLDDEKITSRWLFEKACEIFDSKILGSEPDLRG